MVLQRPTRFDFLLAAAYGLAAAAAIGLTRFEGGVAFLWVAAAVLIPVLVERRRRDWATPLLMCGVTVGLLTGLLGLGWALAVPMAFFNMVEAYVGATLLARRRANASPLGSLKWLIDFALAVGVWAPLAAAVLVGPTLAATGRPFVSTFVQFFTGHALGNVTFIPVVTLIVSGRFMEHARAMSRGARIEAGIVMSIFIAATLITFSIDTLPLLFLPCGFMVLAIFRGREIGAAMSVVILAIVGGGATAMGDGPIALIHASLGYKLQFFQLYLALVVLTALPIAADLKNRSRLHRELRFSEARYRMLADHMTNVIMHLEPDGTVRYISPSIQQIAGYDPDALIGSYSGALIYPDDLEHVQSCHQQTMAAAGEMVSFEYRATTADGNVRWFESHARAILDRGGRIEAVLSVLHDVTRRKSTEARLREAALTDPLTGLPNRRAFREAAEAIISEGRPAAIAIIDLDHFKQINDRFGHDGGDLVLQYFAKQAQAHLRLDDLVARLGGEEFALLMPGTQCGQAIELVERLRRDIADMVVPSDAGAIRVTVSGGIARLDDLGLEAALKLADNALYEAKAGGRDRLALAA